MEEAYKNAIEELKRIDHMVYVSLKYTRTVDVIKNIINRMISCFDFGMDSLLLYAKEKKMIKEVPSIPAFKSEILEKVFKDNKEILDYIQFYLRLRKISRAEYTKREEYRRHVTMTANLIDGTVVEINIDILKEYYEKIKSFMNLIKSFVQGKND